MGKGHATDDVAGLARLTHGGDEASVFGASFEGWACPLASAAIET